MKNKDIISSMPGDVPADIRVYGDPVLKVKCRNVTKLDGGIKTLVDAMARSMYSNSGVGLAAPQIGVAKRIIIADIGEGLFCLINPKILKMQGGKEVMAEGCLSVPGINIEIKRHTDIIVEGVTRGGEKVKMEIKGLLSRVLQHEIDHLDGILITDRVSKKKLRAVKQELDRIEKERGAGK